MSKGIEENRWSAPEDQFAVQIQIPDLVGVLSKKLLIEPGTRALFIEEGQYLGEIPPGTYTLESFTERLRFWRRKQATVILARQEDIQLGLRCSSIPTAENLLVDVETRFTVQLEEIALFLRNLLGARPQFSVQQLCDALSPLVRQSLWESVGKLSITELTGPAARRDIDAAVEQALELSMRRYGLHFGQVQMVSVRHEKFDEQQRKVGEAWLLKGDIEQAKALDQLYSDEELRKIKRQERTNELQTLAQHVDADRQEGELATKIRRVGIRNQWRATILSERFDVIKNEDELARALQEQDKGRLIRDREREELVSLFRDQKADRESARQHLVRKIDLEREVELAQLRADLNHAEKLKTLAHEMELARIAEDEQRRRGQTVEAEENRRWLASLERARQQADHDRQQQEQKLQQQRQWATTEAMGKREDEWQQTLHNQRVDRLRGETDMAKAERGLRVAQLEAEFKAARDAEELAAKRRTAEMEQDLKKRRFDNQLDRLKALQEMNAQFAAQQQAEYERRRRLDAELERLKADQTSQAELARLQALSAASVEAVIATTDMDHARLLLERDRIRQQLEASRLQTELEKQRLSEQTAQATGEARVDQKLAEAKAAHLEASKSEQLQLFQQLLAAQQANAQQLAAAERTAAERLVQAYQAGMSGQQNLTQQSLAAMVQLGQGHQPTIVNVPSGGGMQPVLVQTPGTVPLAATGAAAGSSAVVVCGKCRAENPRTARFCSNCGGQL